MTDSPTAESAFSAPASLPQSAETPEDAPQANPADSVPAEQPPRPVGFSLAAGPFTHGRCGRWWTGKTVGHCGACHREFSSGAFDRHQRLVDGVVVCSTEGLVAHPKPYGTLWRMAGNDHWGLGRSEDAL